MTIQEYIKIAILGFPKKEFLLYQKYFTDMRCEHCIYNNGYCKHPEADGVCIEYEVGKASVKFKEWWK